MSDEWRARCAKHKEWRGPWRRFSTQLEADLRRHIEHDHPLQKNPRKAARRVVKAYDGK